jgi:hypothetical protein
MPSLCFGKRVVSFLLVTLCKQKQGNKFDVVRFLQLDRTLCALQFAYDGFETCLTFIRQLSVFSSFLICGIRCLTYKLRVTFSEPADLNA